MNNNLLNKVTSFEDCIIEVPLAEVFINGESKGFHNEYTVRRILVAVKRDELENNFHFVFNGKTNRIVEEKHHTYFSPNFDKGFFDISYELAFALMD